MRFQIGGKHQSRQGRLLARTLGPRTKTGQAALRKISSATEPSASRAARRRRRYSVRSNHVPLAAMNCAMAGAASPSVRCSAARESAFLQPARHRFLGQGPYLLLL